MRYLPGTMTHEQTEEQLARFIRHWEKRGFGLWAVEEQASDAFIGFVGLLYHHDWPEDEHKTELGWRLDRSYWGRGFATEGALASLRHGFEELKLKPVISITLPENLASRRVMEKCGLTFRGETCWKGCEVLWYAIDRRTWEDRSWSLPAILAHRPGSRSTLRPSPDAYLR